MTMTLGEADIKVKTLCEDDIKILSPRGPAPIVAGDPTYDDEDWWDTPGEIWDDHDR